MRFMTVMLALCVCLQVALAQTDSTQAAPAATPAPAAAPAQGQRPPIRPKPRSRPATAKSDSEVGKQVPSDAAVITIAGLCSSTAPKPKAAPPAAAAKKASCPPTIVTKAQLERLIESVRPNLPPNQRLPLAQQYVQLLTVADAASKAGLDKDPRVQQELQLQRLQILASVYSKDVAQKTSEIPDAELQKYYNEHHGQYQQLKLQRIYIPAAMTADGKPADEATSKALTEKIQKRAATGEDFEKLQKEAFAEANNKNTPPAVDMGERRRGTLPPKQESAVFELNAGDVSPVYEESSGSYVYKVVSKEVIPLDKVKDEIKTNLGRERFREKMDQLKATVKPTFNMEYFGSGSAATAVGAPHPPMPTPAAPAAAPTPPPAPSTTAQPTTPPGAAAQPAAPSGTTEAPKTPAPAPPAAK